jgi:hypothetical protein
MMPRPLRFAALTAVALGVLVPGARPALAQDPERRTPPPRRELEDRVRQRFEDMVNRELGLSSEESARVRRIVVAFRDVRRDLGRRQLQLRRSLVRNDEILGDEEARILLDEVVEVQREEARVMEREIERLLTVLSPGQLVRFYALRERMAERVRALQERRGPPGVRGPGGGAPVP